MFDIGDVVWHRLPGYDTNLEEAWDGPFEIMAKKNTVNYQIMKLDGSG